MTTRWLATTLLCLVSLSAGGCANDRGKGWGPLQRLGASPLSMLSSTQAEARESDEPDGAPTMRKTLGGKVLSAIALERATGRKPDPSRLRELD